MFAALKQTIHQQFGAALDTLDNAIDACPDDLWGDRPTSESSVETPHLQFWYMVYHTLFFLDYYLSDSAENFAPPEPFTLSELDPAGVFPERVYNKAEMKTYLEHGRKKLRAALNALTEEKANQRCGFKRPEVSVTELFFYSMRHVQHHAAQLNLILRQKTDSAPGWVSKSKIQ